jgi:Uncharacterized protein involved in copper resistance
MNRKLIIEALAGSADDCAAAARTGMDRIELNSGLAVGGLTPTPGAVELGKRASGLPIMAMLRPRAGSFCYSELEFETMARDAKALLGAGADGLVLGILLPDGRVDETRCAKLIASVECREWVFHRAFDLVPDPFEALESLVALGFRRVLTKGQANSFEDGESLLLKLREAAAGRIEILVPGVRPHNVRHIVAEDGFDQIHLGRFAEKVDASNSARPEVYFGAASKGREHLYEAFDEDYARQMRGLALAP